MCVCEIDSERKSKRYMCMKKNITLILKTKYMLLIKITYLCHVNKKQKSTNFNKWILF